MAHRRSLAPVPGRQTDPPITYDPGVPDRAAAGLPPRLAEQLLDETTELVCTATAEGEITYVNRAWQRVLGYTAAEAAALRPVDIVAPEHRGRYVEAARRLVAGEPVEAFEAVLLAKDGRRVVCRGRAVAEMVDGPDGPRCVGTRSVYSGRTADRAPGDALRASESRFRAIFDHAAVGVSVTDPAGFIVEANAALHAMLGYPPGALVGRFAPSLSPAEDAAVTRGPVAALRAGEVAEVTVEKRFIRRDGEMRWVSLTMVQLPLADGESGLLGMLVDVTDRRRAEDALRASEAELRGREARLGLIYNSVSDLMFLLRVERDGGVDGPIAAYRCESVNDAYVAVTGMSRGELVGRTIAEMLTVEGAAVLTERYGLAVATGDVLRYDEEVDLPAGRVVLETTLSPILDDLGVCTHLLGASRDVSARRRAEAALRASEARHRALFERSTAMQWLVDPRERRIADANEAAARFYGYPLAELRGKSLLEIEALTAPARPAPAAAAEGAGASGGKAVVVHRVASGALRQVEVHVTSVELDGLTYDHAILHDVTERIAAEEALRESEARVRGAVEASLDAFLMCRSVRAPSGAVVDFDIVDCNTRAGALWGMVREELVGQRMLELFPLVRTRGLFQAFRRVADSGEPQVLEYELGDPRARIRWAKLQVVRLGDGVAITLRDVTEQKHAEETLRSLALVDELTGVHNRRGFMALAEREWQRARREGRGAILAYIDLDDFKGVNDTHGHAEGDRALCAVADVLRSTFRGADVIGRLGGDEFAVLVVPGGATGTDAVDAGAVEQRVRERLTQHLALSNAAARTAGRPYDLAMSVGMARASQGELASADSSLAALMVQADERLYDEKRRRRL